MTENKERDYTISIEAENDILGSILIDADILAEIKTIIEPGYFYLPKHRVIYNAMLALEKEQQPIDATILGNKLKEIGKLDEIGGLSYLIDLADGVATTANTSHYAKILRDKYQLRDATTQLRALIDKGDQGISNTEFTNTLNQIVSKVSQPDFFGRPPLTIHDRATDLLENLIHSEPALPSSHNQLDRALSGGFQKGRMYIIDGLTGGGKSTFALNVADDLAESGLAIPVIVLFELTASELLEKSISRIARIDSRYIASKVWSNDRHPYNNLTEHDQQEIRSATTSAFDQYKDGPGRSLYVLDDTSGWTTAIIKSVVSQIKNLNPDKDVVLFIDPVQMLLTGDKTADREPTLRTGVVAGQCKQLARDLYVPVVLLSDTTKEAQGRKERGEKMSLTDIRGSFELSQRADVTLHITFGNNVFDKILKDATDQDYIRKIIQGYNNLKIDRAKTAQAIIQVGKQRSGDSLTAFYAWHRAFNHFQPVKIEDGETGPDIQTDTDDTDPEIF